jgi:hypothetical protein
MMRLPRDSTGRTTRMAAWVALVILRDRAASFPALGLLRDRAGRLGEATTNVQGERSDQ